VVQRAWQGVVAAKEWVTQKAPWLAAPLPLLAVGGYVPSTHRTLAQNPLESRQWLVRSHRDGFYN